MEPTRKRMGSPVGARMIINDREVDYFCGTSYYTLHGHPRVIQAARDAVAAYGLGPATDAAVPPVEEVKELAKAFFDTETATYVISGYLGAMVLAQALSHDYDLVFVDERSHYSVFDGVASSGKQVVRFRHLDAADLREKLKAFTGPGQVPLVMSDGVFPVTGAIAPLPSYAEVLSGYTSALLCTDDSHAVGVIGARGRGTFEYHGMSGSRYYTAGTLSKACGGIGGIIPGNRSLADRIAEHVRVPIGASGPSVPAAAAAAMGLRILTEHPEMRERLWQNARFVRRGFRDLGFEIADNPIPIVNVKGHVATNLKRVEEKLLRNDIVVLYVPPRGYSDAPDIESLRIAVFSAHTEAQIARLLDTVRRAV
jgi:8-amino-7-oxononanoate synthase